MSRRHVMDVLFLIRPGALWQTDGDTFEDVVWLDDVQSRPTAGEFADGEVLLAWQNVRSERDRLLTASDWTQVADAPVDSAAWAVYRQQLRDIPQDFDSPDDVVWPAAP